MEGESSESFISHLLELLLFLEETEIINSHISSNVGCQEVRDVEHHSEHATPLEMLRLLILENDFDLRLRLQLGFLHWFHFLLYWAPPLMLELVVLQKLGNSILGRGNSLVPS